MSFLTLFQLQHVSAWYQYRTLGTSLQFALQCQMTFPQYQFKVGKVDRLHFLDDFCLRMCVFIGCGGGGVVLCLCFSGRHIKAKLAAVVNQSPFCLYRVRIVEGLSPVFPWKLSYPEHLNHQRALSGFCSKYFLFVPRKSPKIEISKGVYFP